MRKSYKNLELICDNLGTLYEDGIPIYEAIILLKELDLNKNYKKTIDCIEKSLLKGESLAESFELFPQLYPPLFRAFINIGERNGKLAKVLKSLSKYYSNRKVITNKLITASTYPIFLVSVMIIMVFMLIIFLIPTLYNTLNSLSSDIPDQIELLNNAGNYIRSNPIIFTFYFVSYFIIIPILLYKLITIKIDVYKIILKLKLIKIYYENLLILVLSIIFESGTNISEGIDNCSNYCDEVIIRTELKRINIGLYQGMELSDILKNGLFISKSSIAMIKIGERGGSMEYILKKLECRIGEEFYNKISKLIEKVQPTMILIMAALIGTFISIFILPIFNMMNI